VTDLSPAVQFAFAVALKPRSASCDWGRVQDDLRRTVRSARAASRGYSSVVLVACHEEPDLGDVADADVHIRAVPFPRPADAWEGGRDKARKRRFAAAWLRQVMSGGGAYVMFLDADDLVHHDLVRYVMEWGHGSYLVDRGYFVDVAAGLVHRRRADFHKACGSSFVCRFERDELPTSWDDLSAPFSRFGATPEQRGHQDYDQVAAELGRAPISIPFPAVAYLVNHPESLRAAKGREMRSLIDPFELVSPGAARRILARDFAAPDLAATLAGCGGATKALLGASKVRLGNHRAALVRRLRARISG
jgi:hypothetical protein